MQRSVRASLNQESNTAAQIHPLQAPLSWISNVTTTTTTTDSLLTSYPVCDQILYSSNIHLANEHETISLKFILPHVEIRPKHNFKNSRPPLSPNFENFQFLECFMEWVWNTKCCRCLKMTHKTKDVKFGNILCTFAIAPLNIPLEISILHFNCHFAITSQYRVAVTKYQPL